MYILLSLSEVFGLIDLEKVYTDSTDSSSKRILDTALPIAPDEPITATFFFIVSIYGQLKIKEEKDKLYPISSSKKIFTSDT